MFLDHFSLAQHPFSEKPPLQWIQRDPRIDDGLARLTFFQEQGSIGLIIGQTGLGKSSLLRLFIHELPQNRFNPVYLHLTPLSATAFLRLIVTNLGEKAKIGKDRIFTQIIERVLKNEKCTLLIIDEAHLIDPKTLTDLRLLISSIDDNIALKILFSGQEGLSQILKQSCHADLIHRVSLRFCMKPLSKDQTSAYIDARVQNAGGAKNIFDSAAKGLIYDYTNGVPRQVNNIATACLLNGASRDLKTIDENLVNDTMNDFFLP